MLISERIQSLAPANAAFYRLAIQLTDETVKVYPLDLKMFKLGDPPTGVPSGGYTICYYDAGYGPITHANKSIRLDQHSEALLARSAQLSLHTGNPGSYGGATSPLPRLALPAPTPAGTSGSPASPVPGYPPEPRHPVETRAEASGAGSTEPIDRELRAHLHAMDLEDRQQEFLKGTLYATELGEAFGLNRILRRDLMELQRVIVLHSQSAYKEVAQVKGTVQDLLQLQREVLAAAAQQIAQPPPPPPDYVSLGHSALAAIREIGVAMVHRGQSKDEAAKTPPLLAAPSSEEAAAQPSPRGDAIDRMVSKLRSVSDQDIALAMSAPDRWKALLDDLVSGKKEPAPSGPPPQGQTESKEEGGAP